MLNKRTLNSIKKLFWIGFFKTIYINFRLLPFKQAIHFPILVTRATTFGSLSGKINIQCPVKFSIIKFGFNHSDLTAWNSTNTFISIKGLFVVKGWMQFGVGFNFIVDENAELTICRNSSFGARGVIICRNKIYINKNFRAGWEVQIMDTNFHFLKNTETGKVYSRFKPIIIGRNNWLGFRTSVMQGTKTPDYFSVASNSICNKDYTKLFPSFSLVGGTPVKLLKENIVRVLNREEREIQRIFDNTNEFSVVVDKEVREV